MRPIEVYGILKWPNPGGELINKKRRTCYIKDFVVPVDDRGKIKESKKIDNYLDIARELKKLYNVKVSVM